MREAPDVDEDAGTPRWVKVGGLVLLLALAIVVALHLTGNSPGGHGP